MEIADTYEGKDIYGPIWTGKLFDEKITSLIPNIDKYTEIMKEEAKINEMFFYDLHEICETFKRNVPNYKETQEMIKKKGFKSSRTTFCETAIKTNMPKKEFLKMIKGIRAS
jgi:tRNA G26 N,N-dimethylase Trm1